MICNFKCSTLFTKFVGKQNYLTTNMKLNTSSHKKNLHFQIIKKSKIIIHIKRKQQNLPKLLKLSAFSDSICFLFLVGVSLS